ncbi:hypothetical protein [Aliarcobacter butzleri]|uniref:hypothetical protein n=1 Tax=Aliarcobacter butzleri TaxID=28197 RepID=UPI002876109C|nr:hypothetical protein [Aliarcobacter butzleri]MDS1315135.1 hypothetical protein [Aliarcobacter butzleri]
MAKIVVTGAGSAQSNGVINCLLEDKEDEIIGFGSDIFDLMLCNAHKKYLIPHSRSLEYKEKFLSLLSEIKPDMIHFQHDLELYIALKFKDEIEALGVKLFVPDYNTIETCVYKYKSWEKFKNAGIIVPENIIINNSNDLKKSFKELGNEDGIVWFRSMSIGGGGKGSFPTNDYDEAYEWISKNNGWGDFVAAELLTDKSVTWLSIWNKGELVVGQTRIRKGWAHSALSVSGVTGVTKIGEIFSDKLVDEVAMNSVRAVSEIPHGIYGVDMTYDKNGIPNPTEINISRFFTTIEFFAQAGLNMPLILKNLCLYEKTPELCSKLNPLKNGLLWLRGMDCKPKLTTYEEIEKEIIGVKF